jgi:hypothetical protein
MHELEGPRLAARHRPADFSAIRHQLATSPSPENPPGNQFPDFPCAAGVPSGAAPVSGDKRISTQL